MEWNGTNGGRKWFAELTWSMDIGGFLILILIQDSQSHIVMVLAIYLIFRFKVIPHNIIDLWHVFLCLLPRTHRMSHFNQLHKTQRNSIQFLCNFVIIAIFFKAVTFECVFVSGWLYISTDFQFKMTHKICNRLVDMLFDNANILAW